MPLRLAFDLDGVLADMHAALAREAEQLFTVADAQAVATFPHLTSSQTEALWRHVAAIENFWEGLAELEPGTVARLAGLAARQHWEVVFLTQRPGTAGAAVQRQTQRWLQRHGFELPSVCTTRRSRGTIAAALDLDVVVDDRFEGCAAVAAESRARAVLVWREPDRTMPARARRLGVAVVHSVGECLDLLEDVDRADRGDRRFLARVRDALRLTRGERGGT